MSNYVQRNFLELNNFKKKIDTAVIVSNFTFVKKDQWILDNYTEENYERDVILFGLKNVWDKITYYLLNYSTKNELFNSNNIACLYEKGLAIVNKEHKKNCGQYYTPFDVATIMSKWLDSLQGENICDVACGTGNLVLTYLDFIGKDRAIQLLKGEKLYLYDNDGIALNICETLILLKYGMCFKDKIHIVKCDFLDANIKLPNDCKTISNPPYSVLKGGNVLYKSLYESYNSKELYAMFMEKIITQSRSAVIITPYSFIGGDKFYSLRKLMNDYSGFIISFDNVPGNIFNGKKQGVFNSNTVNSVRAAITVLNNNYTKGFALTPLIRFKNEERERLLDTEILEKYLNNISQKVNVYNRKYLKCHDTLFGLFQKWQAISNKMIGDYISTSGEYLIAMPNTCRYYTTGSNSKLKRNGQIILNISDKDVFNYLFCFINSSFTYWYWRIYDGGITYPKNLLLRVPVFFDILTDRDKIFFEKIADELIQNKTKFIIKKNNKGMQENIKFPRYYRDVINRRLLDIIGIKESEKIFDMVHSNTALEISL